MLLYEGAAVQPLNGRSDDGTGPALAHGGSLSFHQGKVAMSSRALPMAVAMPPLATEIKSK